MITNYNYRQFQLMYTMLVQYQQGKVSLSVLINRLATLLDVLQEVDEFWVKKFRSEWWTLEQIYAVGIDQGRENLSSEDKELIKNAIDNMLALLDEVWGDQEISDEA